MFFWGIGTSKIASNSFGWDETASAAALAGENVLSFYVAVADVDVLMRQTLHERGVRSDRGK